MDTHPAPHTPRVSVIMATYNRSNIIHHAIHSVLRQTFTDLELIVVGDACTDDTEAVVKGIDDPRVRFINLDRNVGEQSGPNNHGVRLACGSWIAFLNHDDLWFEDHLERATEHLERTQAGLVWTLGASMLPDGTPRLIGSSQSMRYEPHVVAVASSWLVRREVIDHVGPWRNARELHSIPSQEWLYRAHRLGVRMRLCPHLSVVAIQSGTRRNVYRDRAFLEHDHQAAEVFGNPHYRQMLLTRIAHAQTSSAFGLFEPDDLRVLRRKLFFALCRAFRLHPSCVWAWLRFRRKGGVLAYLRHVRGLERSR